MKPLLSAAALLMLSGLTYADTISGEVHRQPLNICSGTLNLAT
ncbi:hypothetical protein [Serratia symbiotica]|nr:hypothetical protein [Serratia symbiotica]